MIPLIISANPKTFPEYGPTVPIIGKGWVVRVENVVDSKLRLHLGNYTVLELPHGEQFEVIGSDGVRVQLVTRGTEPHISVYLERVH